MSDTVSHLREHDASAAAKRAVGDEKEESPQLADGSARGSPSGPAAVPESGTPLSAPSARVAPPADEATMISNRPPIAAPAVADPIHRLLEGHVTPGDRLGHFELLEYVGGGGMGRVFRARDCLLGRMVALKILPPEQASDADALQRFQNEAQSAARLDHDNIVRAYYVGEDRGLNYIAFEFVEGTNVRALVEQKGPLPLADVVGYTLQVAEALAHAESREVVHRDIKPSNVLVTPEGRVKLIDMGLARLRQPDPAAADLTASGVTLGTFDYISPEQARDPRSADIRSDIYSLGCTVFFMLAGQPPFPRGTVLQKLLQHQGDEPPDIRQFRPDLPPEVTAVLRKMMAKDRASRYAGPAELIADLMVLADQIGLRPVSQSARLWLVPPETRLSFLQRHMPWVAAVVALIGIVVALDLTWTSSSQRDAGLPTNGMAAAPATKSIAAPTASPRESDETQDPAADRGSGAAQPSNVPSKGSILGRGAAADAKVFGGKGPASRPGPPPDAEAAAQPFAVLVVRDSPQGDHEYSTLAAACAAARSGDVIELQFDGSRTERPIQVPNINLTICAADGYRPILVFRPTDANPIKPRSMLTLTSGQLTLIDVAVELWVPRGVMADDWSLVETEGGQMVRFERCSLTVCNATDQGATYHQDVAFFRARSARDADVVIDSARAATPLATVELVDCTARGEADFLRVDDPQPVSLTWDNGLLLTSERLLTTGGSQSAPKPDEMLRIELRHITAVMRSGLCRLASSPSNPHQLSVQFVSTNCILITPAGVPLVEQDGASSVEESRGLFVWNGDRNFYEGVDTFWSVSTMDPEAPTDVMNFEAWKTWWGPSRENQPSTERLQWKSSPEASRPLHSQGIDDYTLEDTTGGDNWFSPPGCRTDRLPSVPAELAPERYKPPLWRRDASTARGPAAR